MNIHTRNDLAHLILDYLDEAQFYSPPANTNLEKVDNLFLEDLHKIMLMIYNKDTVNAIKYLRTLEITKRRHPGKCTISLDTPKPAPIDPTKYTIEEYIQDRWMLDKEPTGKQVIHIYVEPSVSDMSLYMAKAVIYFLAKIPQEYWMKLPKRETGA